MNKGMTRSSKTNHLADIAAAADAFLPRFLKTV